MTGLFRPTAQDFAGSANQPRKLADRVMSGRTLLVLVDACDQSFIWTMKVACEQPGDGHQPYLNADARG